ncbi:hypothetical protein [Streptomyces sp. NPDC007088]
MSGDDDGPGRAFAAGELRGGVLPFAVAAGTVRAGDQDERGPVVQDG